MDTITMLGVYGRLVPFNTFILNLLFPEVMNFETAEIGFDKVFKDYRLAPFVSPLVAGKANTQQGAIQKSFKPAYVKPKDVLDPARVLKRRPGEAIGGTLSAGARRDAIVVDILDEQRQRILNRKEWMAAQLLRTGTVTVEGPDYPTAVVDFGRATNHTVTLASDARWSETASKPSEDLETWMDRLDAPCTHIICGRGAFRKLVNHASSEKLIDSKRGSETVLELAPSAMMATFRGRLGAAGPEIWTYAGWYIDDAGVKKYFVEDNQVILISVGATGVQAHGAIMDGKAGYQAMEIFPKVYETDDPACEFVLSQSAPLPILPLINSTLCANVYTL